MQHEYIIAQDGSGDFTTIQEAIDSVWNQRGKHWYWRLWYVLFPIQMNVAPGTYHIGKPINVEFSAGPFHPRIEIKGCKFVKGAKS